MKNRFSYPGWIEAHCIAYAPYTSEGAQEIARIRKSLANFSHADPEVCIVIPAFNEEKNLLSTLSSLSAQDTEYRVLLMVINNNSTDRTQEILDACGVQSVFEPRQGISYTRQTGLEHAKGTYYLSADADSIYPPGWVGAQVQALKIPGVSCSYGRHSFIPSHGKGRLWLGLYEIVGEWFFDFRRNHSKEYLNVLGFNFGFKRMDGLKIGGFNINRQRWQDGWMGMELQKLGRLHGITTADARVWTSDRRLKDDGPLFNAFLQRVKKHLTKLYQYSMQKKPLNPEESGNIQNSKD